MTQRVIGLDIGTHAVRATEIRLSRGGGVTVTRFGQVALPAGVVRGGEVIDPGRCSDAIRRLWKEVGFTSRKVIIGAGNQRVIVRPAEIPAMGEDDLRAAVALQAGELIPMPLDEVVLDHQVLERFVDADGADLMRVLIVAAQRDMVGNLLEAVEGAGLTASLVDLVPFAMLRSLADTSGFDDLENGHPTGEAIVSIGAGVTTVVVHERGIPKFVRMLMRGGESLTEGIANDLEVDFEAAEGLKRQVSIGLADADTTAAARSLQHTVEGFAEEITATLRFHTSQPTAAPLARIVVTGGGTRSPGLAEQLANSMGVPVTAGAPFSRVELGKTGLSDVQIREAEDLAAVSLGLALAGRPVDRGARRLNLLPPEVSERIQGRQQAALVGAAVAVLIAGLMFMWWQRKSTIEEVNAQVDEVTSENMGLQANIAQLAPYQAIETDFETRSALVGAALSTDVAWSKLIQEVATVLPDDVWLDAFTGTAPVDGKPGEFLVTGRGANHTSSARWLLRLDSLESVGGMWVPNSVVQLTDTGIDEVTFNSSAQITNAALSGRIERYLDQILIGALEGPSPEQLAMADASDTADGEDDTTPSVDPAAGDPGTDGGADGAATDAGDDQVTDGGGS